MSDLRKTPTPDLSKPPQAANLAENTESSAVKLPADDEEDEDYEEDNYEI